MKYISAFIAGAIFSMGLVVTQMVNPEKVLAFLDVFGAWDPSLSLVMVSALIVTSLGYKFILKRSAPAFDTEFQVPTNSQIDMRLIVGAILFGIGWGLVGLCPGPALAALTLGGPSVLIFAAAMLSGIIAYEVWQRSKA